jgi:hypothetical protein
MFDFNKDGKTNAEDAAFGAKAANAWGHAHKFWSGMIIGILLGFALALFLR